ncbi:MAG: pyridoxamine kinase [Clostridia bacterium]|nr:pyridoxamine kinase [Clostridia bacterium]
MKDIKVLTIQDISCVGQCSLTVALPIISACGVETCVLPSAVLSTHTAGFKNFTFRDLTSDIPAIFNHWKNEGLSFDAVYTGYLGSAEQIEYMITLAKNSIKDGGKFIVDPAFADNGKLYPAFDLNYVNEMKRLVAVCDVVVPNLSEACFLCGIEYKTEYDESYVKSVVDGLVSLGAKSVVLTGIGYEKGYTGIVTFENGVYSYYKHEFLPNSCHGTGDIYASAFVGAVVNGKSLYDASVVAADFTVLAIKETAKYDNHWYGAKFEPVLYKLNSLING